MENLKDTERFGSTYKEGEDLEEFLEKLQTWIERRVFDRTSKRVNFLLLRLEDGTDDGQMLYYDNTNKKWVHTETSEMVWSDISKALGINRIVPNSGSKLDVGGTVMVTRILAGGVGP